MTGCWCPLGLLTSLPAEDETAIDILLIGDSTVTDAAGWGKAFADRCRETATVHNLAVGGRSSRSWHDEQRLPAALALKPDIVIVQFGHNDQPGKGRERETDPATTYREFLRLYVTAFREIGAKAILVSSVTRRTFDTQGKIASSLTPWAEATGAVALEMGVPFIDLHSTSIALHNEMGPDASMGFNPKPDDRTHFNEIGARAVADLIIRDLQTLSPELAQHLRQAPTGP
ncbi:MAG: rhamnogalacturonan acetylesterase [Gemmatimonadetes bacterium]|nr:rhamnogalacturonan acetylesterase [Gemmatimonadota bacterium]